MGLAPLIEIRDLSIGFTSRSGAVLSVLRNVDLSVGPGESVGIVGESGSGKSTLALAAMGYLKRGLRVLGGSAAFRGNNLFAMAPDRLQSLRGGELALIPQNSGQSLSPNLRIGAQIEEVLRLHTTHPGAAHADRVSNLLAKVRLPDPKAIAQRYPHELSGGQQQRAAIAMALAGEPQALLLDEPTTGLDVTTQAHILELLAELAAQSGVAMIYVSHDLGAIARVCDRVVVMYAGEVVLSGSKSKVLTDPSHPYARGLLGSIPRLSDNALPLALDGRPPAPGAIIDACAFADRCTLAEEQCRSLRPQLTALPDGGAVRCFREAVARAQPVRRPAEVRSARSIAGAAQLTLDHVSMSYAKPGLVDQLLGRKPGATPTVDDISFQIRTGETIALVGESGSGKSTILKAVAGLVPPISGRISHTAGDPLAPRVEQRRPEQLRAIQLIFQNPDESLNPRHTIAESLAQPLELYFGLMGSELRRRSIELLESVRLGAHYLDRLPSQLSGGEKQRVAIARAFAAEPDLVLCDEVTSALDVSVQAAVLDLLDVLRRERGTAYLFVSHDLAVVRALADRVAVLYQGRLCEIGPTSQVYAAPCHPYTEALLGAVLEPVPHTRPVLLAEDIVEMSPPARGCPFQRRCHRRIGEICSTQAPPERRGQDGHIVKCHIPLDELERLQEGNRERGLPHTHEPPPHGRSA
jgi:peptide/nickel transport system ATP-binding protein